MIERILDVRRVARVANNVERVDNNNLTEFRSAYLM